MIENISTPNDSFSAALKLLKHIGECTAYSAKGHYKTADCRRIGTYSMIVINFLLSIVGLTNLFSSNIVQIFSAVSLFASIMLIYIEANGGNNLNKKHHTSGTAYLNLNHESYALFLKGAFTFEEVQVLFNKMIELNASERPEITTIGAWQAKMAIEDFGEITPWWK